jgi:hypothetical protein
MAKRSTSKRTKSSKSTTRKGKTTKRGGFRFSDLKDAASKLKNEITNPKSLLRQQFYREAPLRNEILQTARQIAPLTGRPDVIAATETANIVNEVAKTLGFGRKKKYVKYVKSKTHGKHGKIHKTK